MGVGRRRSSLVVVGVAVCTLVVAPVHAQLPDHPIITEVYPNPPGANDGPVGRDPSNLHQEFIEIWLPDASVQTLGGGLTNKDAVNLTLYEVEGDSGSTGYTLVNYRIDLPTLDLDLSNGEQALARPASGVIVIGWVDYDRTDPPSDLAGTASTRVALINGGVTSTTDFLFIALNGDFGPTGGTTNFPVPLSISTINIPGEPTSGIIQNGSGAYLLVNRDDVGYIELYDDKDTAHVPSECSCTPEGCDGSCTNANPSLAHGDRLLVSSLLDGFAANDDGSFDVFGQPFTEDPSLDLSAVLPEGGAYSLLISQLPETDRRPPAPGLANGYARLFVDVAKTTENVSPDDDDPVADATEAYRHVRTAGPFFPTPGKAAMTTSAPELAVALETEQFFEVLLQTTGRPGILAANVGGSFGIDMTATPGASSDSGVATFASGFDALDVGGQQLGFPSMAITPGGSAVDGSSATASVTIGAVNTNGGDPAVVSPMRTTTATVTILDPKTGLDQNGAPLQTTVFVAIQGVPTAAVANEFLNTDLGAYVAANLGGSVQDTRGNGALLVNFATDLSDGAAMDLLIREFPDPGFFINAVGAGLDLVQTVEQSAEVLSGSGTYFDSIEAGGVRAIRLNHPDTLTSGGTFSPSEIVHFANAKGGIAGPRNGLSYATTTRGFELVIVDTNAKVRSVEPFDNYLETGATDDFGIVVEVLDTEPGAAVVTGEFVFLSFSGGLQGADLDTLEVPPGGNVLVLIYLDLDNLHTELGIRTIEQIHLIDGSGNGQADVIEVFSLNPVGVNALLTSAAPATGQSLWRSAQNTIRLTFNRDITAPAAGQIRIEQMLPGGTFGTDLSAGFSVTVENDLSGNPRVLKIVDTVTPDLTHRNWYALRNTGGWLGVDNFTVQYVVQVGDANNDGAVLNVDASLINTGIPNLSSDDDDRRDIDGDLTILNDDVSTANVNIPSFAVAKPSGH